MSETSIKRLIDIIGETTGRPAEMDPILDVTDDSFRLVADISKIRTLGYAPKVSLSEGIEDLADDLGETPAMPSGSTIFKKGQKAEQ